MTNTTYCAILKLSRNTGRRCAKPSRRHTQNAPSVYTVFQYLRSGIYLFMTYSVSYSFPVHTPFGGFTAVLRRMTIPVNSTKRPLIHTGRQYSRPFAYGGFYMRQKMIT